MLASVKHWAQLNGEGQAVQTNNWYFGSGVETESEEISGLPKSLSLCFWTKQNKIKQNQIFYFIGKI